MDNNNGTFSDPDILALEEIRDSLLKDIGNSFSIVEENKHGSVGIGKQNLVLITKGKFKGVVYGYRGEVSFRETENGNLAVIIHPQIISHQFSDEEIDDIERDDYDSWKTEFFIFAQKVATLLTLYQLLGKKTEITDKELYGE